MIEHLAYHLTGCRPRSDRTCRRRLLPLIVAWPIVTVGSFTGIVAAAMPPESQPGIVTVADGRFPTSISEDGHHMLDQLGEPWMMKGDAGWEVVTQLGPTDADQYLQDRAAKGFNTVLIQLIDNGAFTTNGPNNYNNDSPFTGTAFASTLGPAFWGHVDHVLSRGAELGITFVITPAYHGITTDGWRDHLINNITDADMEAYGAAIGARYASYPNIIWAAGGDSGMEPTLESRWNAFFAGLAAAGDIHLRTFHGGEGNRGLVYAGPQPWLDVDNVYDYGIADDDIVELSNASFVDPSALPTFYIEGRYEEENSSTRHSLRRQIYSSVFAGCLGGWIWGNNPMWHFNGRGPAGPPEYDSWQEALNSPSTADAVIAIGFFNSLAGWNLLVPDTADTFLTSAESSAENTSAAAFSDRIGLVYVATTENITVDLTQLAPPTVRLRWFDPTDGTYRPVGPFANTGSETVTHPGSNSAGDNDWVLVVDEEVAS